MKRNSVAVALSAILAFSGLAMAQMPLPALTPPQDRGGKGNQDRNKGGDKRTPPPERRAPPERRTPPPNNGNQDKNRGNDRKPAPPPGRKPAPPERKPNPPQDRKPTPPPERKPNPNPPNRPNPTPPNKPVTPPPDNRQPPNRPIRKPNPPQRPVNPPVTRPPSVRPPVNNPNERVRVNPRPTPIERDHRIPDNDHRRVVQYPRSDRRGRPINDTPIVRHPDHRVIVGNGQLVRTIDGHYASRHTLRVGHRYTSRYYWNNRWYDYSYYWDGSYFWTGFYFGNSYYFCRYHLGRFWWYDSLWSRLCYWNNGYWYWEHPTTRIIYVYRNGWWWITRPSRGGVIYEPDPTRPSDPAVQPPADSDQTVFYSEDGDRMVQILGANRHAHLYTHPEGDYLADLGEGVQTVSFSYRKDAQGADELDQIMIERLDKDGSKSFSLYDADGNVYGQQPPAQPTPPAPQEHGFKFDPMQLKETKGAMAVSGELNSVFSSR